MGSRLPRRDGRGRASGLAIQQSQRNAGRDPRLAGEHGLFLQAEFGVAEKFHANFYHDFMEEDELDLARPPVRDFVERMLALNGSERNGS